MVSGFVFTNNLTGHGPYGIIASARAPGNDSIRNNLLWACPEANEELMVEALRKAAAEFVLSLPDGLDTVVGDSGLRLSGGERQRIALARAFLKRPCLLILDEATSALDTENEAKIRTAIERIHGDLALLTVDRPTLG